MYYDDFFKLVGWETSEIESQRPRIEKTLEVFDLTEGDLRRGEERVRQYFDLELKGMRRLLGLTWRELIRLVHAKEDYQYFVYGDNPTPLQPILAMGQADGVCVGTPGIIIGLTLGQQLDKLGPILDAGERAGMLPGKALCSLYIIRVGIFALKLIPSPDLVVSGGNYCDIPPYADDMLRHMTGCRVCYLDRILDNQWGSFDDIPEGQVKYFAERIRQALRVFTEVTGHELSPEQQHEALVQNAKVYYAFQSLVDLAAMDPPPISQTNINYITNLMNAVLDRDEVVEALVTLIGEVQDRADQKYGIMPQGAPAIYFSLSYPVDPAVIKMVEQCGLRIAELCTSKLTPIQMKKSKYTDFWERTADGICRFPTVHSAEGHIASDQEYVEMFKCDGAILAFPYHCRPWTIPPLMSKKNLQEKLDIPVLVLEADSWDTRNYSAEQLRGRVEAFSEVLRMAKDAKAS